MHTKRIASILIAVTVAVSPAWADLSSWFAGYTTSWEVGVSGLQSSYDQDTQAGSPLTGGTISSSLPVLGPQRVSYPWGIGTVPSPGGSEGQNFDVGALGVRISGGQLTVRVATALDPVNGYYSSYWDAWYGVGDMFLSVRDSSGVRHYALLNTWARDGSGTPRTLNGGHFADARNFHVAGGPGGTSLEGHLVQLNSDADITLTGGTGAYTASNAPDGLDMRAYASGGTDLGDANLTHDTVTDGGRTWYIQTWTVGLASLSLDPAFDLALHIAASCGNDQGGLLVTVPSPGAALLGLIGLSSIGAVRRRIV